MKKFSKKIAGYSDQISVKPSEKINFMVSCEPQIKIIYSKIVKLIHGDCNPSGPGYKDEEVKSYGKKKHKAIHQRINSGSYILIPLNKKVTIKIMLIILYVSRCIRVSESSSKGIANSYLRVQEIAAICIIDT